MAAVSLCVIQPLSLGNLLRILLETAMLSETDNTLVIISNNFVGIYIMPTPKGYIFPFDVIYSMWGELIQYEI